MRRAIFSSKPARCAVCLATLCAAITAYASGDPAGDHRHGEPSSIGQAALPGQATRTVTITMLDSMRFSPATIRVRGGETVRFVVRNAGKVKHELVLGTQKDLDEHHAFMQKNPDMEHEDDNMVTVQPGHQSEIIWQFGRAGSVHFACLQPGHYGAGMRGLITVRGKPARDAHEGHIH